MGQRLGHVGDLLVFDVDGRRILLSRDFGRQFMNNHKHAACGQILQRISKEARA